MLSVVLGLALLTRKAVAGRRCFDSIATRTAEIEEHGALACAIHRTWCCARVPEAHVKDMLLSVDHFGSEKIRQIEIRLIHTDQG